MQASPEFAGLHTQLGDLRTTAVADEDLRDEIARQSTSVYESARKATLADLLRFLNSGRALVPTVTLEGPSTQLVELGEDKAKYEALIKEELERQPAQQDQNILVIEDEEGHLSDEAKEAITTGVARDIVPTIEDIQELIEQIQPVRKQQVTISFSSLLLSALGDKKIRLENKKKFAAANRDEQTQRQRIERLIRQISRGSQLASQKIDPLVQQPVEYLTSVYVRAEQQRLIDLAIMTARKDLALRNRALYDQMSPEAQRKEGQRPAARKLLETAGLTPLSVPVAEVVEVVKVNKEKLAPPEEKIEDIGNFEFIFPWLNNGQVVNLPVKRLTTGNGNSSVFIIKAMEGELASISESTRLKSRTRKGETNEYDFTIDHIARTIASGILPWDNNSPFKNLYGEKTGPYQGTPIWYRQEHRASGPRTFFSLQKLNQITTEKQIREINAKGTDNCIVILAETDKSEEGTVISQFLEQSVGPLKFRRRSLGN